MEALETITREIHYDAKAKQIKSRQCSSSLVQTWSYSHSNGLVPVDRGSWNQPYSVYDLSVEEYQRVRQHALKFYETNPEKDPGILKDFIVQFYDRPSKLAQGRYFRQRPAQLSRSRRHARHHSRSEGLFLSASKCPRKNRHLSFPIIFPHSLPQWMVKSRCAILKNSARQPLCHFGSIDRPARTKYPQSGQGN